MDVQEKETPLEAVQRMTRHVSNTKVWAMTKAETLVTKITDAGGEVPRAMQDELAELKKACA